MKKVTTSLLKTDTSTILTSANFEPIEITRGKLMSLVVISLSSYEILKSFYDEKNKDYGEGQITSPPNL